VVLVAVRYPPLLICTHTIEARCRTRLRLCGMCEFVLGLCFCCCLLRCLDALVVQRLVLPTLPCLLVVCKCCLLLGVEAAEVVDLAVIVDLRLRRRRRRIFSRAEPIGSRQLFDSAVLA
jgi:hypothetical protein